ncbi:hypothetical protein GCM10010278_81030 [Streptomyces melanogenes]|nr:hypothetical protein GCM10010278_81030 [Streptomyces melanogenes]
MPEGNAPAEPCASWRAQWAGRRCAFTLHALRQSPVDRPVVPGVGYHPRHAQRSWRDVVELLSECLPVTKDLVSPISAARVLPTGVRFRNAASCLEIVALLK